MHQVRNQVFCPHCQQSVEYRVEEMMKTTNHLDDGHPVEYQRQVVYCTQCQEVIPSVDEITIENLKRLRQVII